MRQPSSITPPPARADLLVVGGGTAGAALAGLVARETDLAVVLLEAGPDYGPLGGGRWPADLLDARRLGLSHDWGYAGLAHPSHRAPTSFERARVIGGCSAHNGCIALLGHRADYDGWARRGNPGWDWEAVAPAFARATAALRVRLVDDAELTPFQAAFVAGATAAGIPRVRDLNDPDDTVGVAASPVNIADGIRWNSALAYLDPVRDQANLTVVGDALVERVVIEGGRAVGVEAVVGGERVRVAAERVVLAAGAYGSPAILLRSGVGPPDELRALGVRPVHALPGVGRGLADHPTVVLRYRGAERLDRAMADFAATRWLPDEQTIAKARSRHCAEAFDLHLCAVTYQNPATGEWAYY
ncbi:MAG TPA: GMC family oxidoreductase, partial [Thermomicrobiales bacterium]|nr:GMC family oxidoreductase [Thermomicrobiales bacterium]